MAAASLPSPEPQEPHSSCSFKRKRSAPVTPPVTVEDPEGAQVLKRAIHVLATEATALSSVTRLYETDPTAKDGLLRAVDCIKTVNENGGKLIVCGVGKSGLVGMKTVATMKSLGLATSFMHAAEALHGDLGDVRENDAILFITFSGRTPELLDVMSHIPDDTPIMVLTSHTAAVDCSLLSDRPNGILLPAPIHEPEETSFGVSAPTTSTTVAMAIGDMLAITAADQIYQHKTADIFRKNHPGGAIGAAQRRKMQ